MEPYIFFADIDGTLLKSGTPLLPEVKAAARRFTQAGGILTLCTGRAPVSTRWLAAELAITAPSVLFSGSVLFDFPANRAVHTIALPGGTLEKLPEIFAAFPGASVQAYTLERAYMLRETPMLRERGIREELEDRVTPLSAVEGEVLKLVLSDPEPDNLHRCRDRFFDDRYHFAFSSRRFAEVVAAGSGKGEGATEVAGRLGVPMERTFIAGDAMTDAAAFPMCGYAFAPENAPEAVRELADEVIPPCDAAGMAAAFDRAIAMMQSGTLR